MSFAATLKKSRSAPTLKTSSVWDKANTDTRDMTTQKTNKPSREPEKEVVTKDTEQGQSKKFTTEELRKITGDTWKKVSMMTAEEIDKYPPYWKRKSRFQRPVYDLLN